MRHAPEPNAFGIILGLAATFGLIYFFYISFIKDTEPPKWSDTFPLLGIILMFFCVWFTFPLAWMRGMLMDPTLIVGFMIGGALFVISGCIRTESSVREERERRNRRY